jgi:hypothetical protein
VAWPQADVPGRLSGGVGFSTDWDSLMRSGVRWATTLVLALGLYVFMRRRVQTIDRTDDGMRARAPR